jgi:hypothetical protein
VTVPLDPTPTPTTASSAPPGTPATPPPAEYRYPTDSGPEWARGRTASEVLGITTQAVDALSRFNQAPQAIQQQPQYQQQAQEPIRDEDFVDGRTFRSGLNAAAQSFAPYLQQSVDLAASNSRAFAESQFQSEFKKYGPEIEAELAKLPRAAWTLDNIKTVVHFVRGKHVDEIVEERARQMIASGESSFRSGGASGPPGSQTIQSNPLESEELPAEYRALLRKQNITRETVREFCRSNNMTEAQWVAMAKNTGDAIISEGERGSPMIERNGR